MMHAKARILHMRTSAGSRLAKARAPVVAMTGHSVHEAWSTEVVMAMVPSAEAPV
jgi:hypothetical protein